MIYLKDGTYLNAKNFDKGWIYDVSRFVATATPEMRKQILESINASVEREDSNYTVSGYCDCSKAVELGKTRHEWGLCYLYVWLDKNGIPFYVGKSDGGNRMADFKYNTRSSEFQDKIREGGCHAVMVVKHVAETNIDEMERWLISYLTWRGYTLVNKKDVPSKEKVILWTLFSKCDDRSDVRKHLGEESLDLYIDWETDMKDYAPIITMLDGVIGVPWDGECAEFTRKQEVS